MYWRQDTILAKVRLSQEHFAGIITIANVTLMLEEGAIQSI